MKIGDVVVLNKVYVDRFLGIARKIIERKRIVISIGIYTIEVITTTGIGKKWKKETFWHGFLEVVGYVTKIPKINSTDPWPEIKNDNETINETKE